MPLLDLPAELLREIFKLAYKDWVSDYSAGWMQGFYTDRTYIVLKLVREQPDMLDNLILDTCFVEVTINIDVNFKEAVEWFNWGIGRHVKAVKLVVSLPLTPRARRRLEEARTFPHLDPGKAILDCGWNYKTVQDFQTFRSDVNELVDLLPFAADTVRQFNFQKTWSPLHDSTIDLSIDPFGSILATFRFITVIQFFDIRETHNCLPAWPLVFPQIRHLTWHAAKDFRFWTRLLQLQPEPIDLASFPNLETADITSVRFQNIVNLPPRLHSLRIDSLSKSKDNLDDQRMSFFRNLSKLQHLKVFAYRECNSLDQPKQEQLLPMIPPSVETFAFQSSCILALTSLLETLCPGAITPSGDQIMPNLKRLYIEEPVDSLDRAILRGTTEELRLNCQLRQVELLLCGVELPRLRHE